ncbi:MAG: putative DNA binding domain-containing protein [Anaerolineales bacterium]|nr:putative DNA binding domain-containing protein [Anaerolineales bacterium]
MAKKRSRQSMQWYAIDLHLHTPASGDFQQPEASFLDILHRAEARGLAMIAFTDHNTVAGYRRMQEEFQQLEMLEKLKRILPEEQARLSEYRRLLGKILVLPGFEFTAMFGFHILAIFSPEKPVRDIEYLLLDLNIHSDQLDNGSATVGATSDVLTAYRVIDEAGGLVIAAHANSSNGVAMRGFPLGGQTKIAYTQDVHLHALEVTDLEHRGSRTTAAFFNGTKPEYPRRMHCIQGSDAHRLLMDPARKKNLGVGDRATEVLLPEVSFGALLDLFQSNDFARARPHRHTAEPAFDFIRVAQEEGANIIQDFHESMTIRGGKRYAIIADVCAFANTNGGTLYIGLLADPKKPVVGISDPDQAIMQLEKEISNRLSPPMQCTLDVHETGSKKIIRVLVPRGVDPPYAVDDSKIYVRSEAETGLAVRDEIVGLVLRGPGRAVQPVEALVEAAQPPQRPQVMASLLEASAEAREDDLAPRTGVEVVSEQERDGEHYYTMRDLRNGNVVKNVTRKSARRLWHYAIASFAELPSELSRAKIQWQGQFGLLRRRKQGKSTRYDLVRRTDDGYRYYFGVTDDGIHGPWKRLVGHEDD